MLEKDTVDTTVAEVYILHFESPYWNKARHYVGYTIKGAENRINIHKQGKGSLLVNYAYNKKGIPFNVGMVEGFDNKKLARYFEKKLKSEGHLSRHCSICQGKKQ